MNNKKSRKTPRVGSKSSGVSSEPASGSPLDVRVLEQIVKLMSANDLNTIEVRDGERRVILKRGADLAAPNATSGYYAPPQMSASPPGLATGAATGAGTATPAVTDDASQLTIKSPMVGTFYAAGAPDLPPMVSVGSQVRADTPVGIIEAMKVFTEIPAGMAGTITEVLARDKQPVEFGQPLFRVEPA